MFGDGTSIERLQFLMVLAEGQPDGKIAKRLAREAPGFIDKRASPGVIGIEE
jgi:hypothetical protein